MKTEKEIQARMEELKRKATAGQDADELTFEQLASMWGKVEALNWVLKPAIANPVSAERREMFNFYDRAFRGQS